MREKRRHPRKQIDVPVTVELDDGVAHAGRMTNIALGGAFIAIGVRSTIGSQAILRVAFPAAGFESKIQSTVRWTNPAGLGLEFASMGAKDTHALVTAIENATELAE